METYEIKRTGVIGLGAMGLQMARHLLRKGFDVTGYDVDMDAMRRAVADMVIHSRATLNVCSPMCGRRRFRGRRQRATTVSSWSSGKRRYWSTRPRRRDGGRTCGPTPSRHRPQPRAIHYPPNNERPDVGHRTVEYRTPTCADPAPL